MCSAKGAPPLTLQQTQTANLQSQLNSFPYRLAEMSRPMQGAVGRTMAGAAAARAGTRALDSIASNKQLIIEELDRRDTLQKEQDRVAKERQQILDEQTKERQRMTDEMLDRQQKASASAEEAQRQAIAELAQAKASQQQEIARMQANQAFQIKTQQESQSAEIAKQQLVSDAASSSLRALGARRSATFAPTATETKRKGRRSSIRTGRPANDLRIGSSNVATGAGVNIGG